MMTMVKPPEQIKTVTAKELSADEESKIRQLLLQRCQELRITLEDLGEQCWALQRRSVMGDSSNKEQQVIRNLTKHYENLIRDAILEQMEIQHLLHSQSSIDEQYSGSCVGTKPPTLDDEDEVEQDEDQPIMLEEQDKDQPMLGQDQDPLSTLGQDGIKLSVLGQDEVKLSVLEEQDEDQPMLLEQDEVKPMLGQDEVKLSMLGQDEVQLSVLGQDEVQLSVFGQDGVKLSVLEQDEVQLSVCGDSGDGQVSTPAGVTPASVGGERASVSEDEVSAGVTPVSLGGERASESGDDVSAHAGVIPASGGERASDPARDERVSVHVDQELSTSWVLVFIMFHQ